MAFTEVGNTGVRIGFDNGRGKEKKFMKSGLESLGIRAISIEWIGKKPHWDALRVNE